MWQHEESNIAITKRTVTVARIAEQAGVSVGTVSKAINGTGQLSAATREKVLETARFLGFDSQRLTDVATARRTYTVGVLTTDSVGRFTIPLLTGAEDALGAGQMSMFLCESRGDPIREQHYIRVLLERRVDGIIVTGRSSDRRASLGRGLLVPVVYALVESEDPEDLSILHDDEEGAALGVTHLLETGRSNIAVVLGPDSLAASEHRLAGARRALEAAGRPMFLGEPMQGDWSEKWGREAAHRLVRSGMTFDGVFCASDQIARGVADGLRENGVDVPGQVGLVGMDNWDIMAEASRPPLTTIDLNLAELGHKAATRLLETIAGKSRANGIEFVSPTIVKRRSTEID